MIPVPQPTDGVSLAAKLTVDDARVVWTHPAHAVDRLVRGCTPAPGAWTTLPDGSRLGLGPVTPLDEPLEVSLAPGEVQVTKSAVRVGTATVPVELGEVRPAGKKLMNAADWARGARLGDGIRLGQEASA